MKFWLRLSVKILLLMAQKPRMSERNALGLRAGWEHICFVSSEKLADFFWSPEADDVFLIKGLKLRVFN
jgi:hypothetical protein